MMLGMLSLGAMMTLAVGCAKQGDRGALPPPEGFNDPDHLEPLDQADYSEQGDVDQAGMEDDDEVEQDAAPKGEPVFEEGMSVEQAMDAARGTERLNIEQEALGSPLTRPELYEPCKLNAGDHFDLRVAVWEGRAVGIDLEMKDAKKKACLIEQIKQIRWRDKVKSLNTVEYSM